MHYSCMKKTNAKTTAAYTDNAPARDSQNLTQYYKEIGGSKPLSLAEESELAKRVREGDRDALNTLIRANLRFVVSVCRNYQHQGLPMSDLINEGNLGLIRAAKRFDETRQFKFISYAVWWIRQSILQALSEQSRMIKLPISRITQLSRIHRCMIQLEQKLERPPTALEISQELQLDLAVVESSVEMAQQPASLDAPRSLDDESGLLDMLHDSEDNSPEIDLLKNELNQGVVNVLDSLPIRECTVLKMYFGIHPHVPYSLEEIGRRLNLTRERVRQIKERAISKLKHFSRSKALYPHLHIF